MIFLSTLFLAVLITIGMTPMLSSLAIRHNVVDLPGARKVHARPIPRIGGIAMACGAFAPLLFWYHADRFVVAFLAGAAVLVFFGLLDDLQDLSPKVKFAGQILAALIVMLGGGVQIVSLGTLFPDIGLLPAVVAIPLTLVAIVGATNAINLSDGLDGLAGGICLLIFSAIGYLAYLEGKQVIGLIALALAGVLFGFLRFNTHPATIFMGDAGSQFLGFSASTLAIALTQAAPTLSPVLPLILLGFPILDTLTVMVTRIVQGRSPFAADKNHFHHHLLGLGLHQAESVLVIYVLQTLLIVAAFLLRYHSDWILLLCYLGFSAVVLAFFTRARSKEWQMHRFKFFDIRVAGRLRILKREGTVIRFMFPAFVWGIPLLLLLTCWLTSAVPGYVSLGALCLAGIVVVTLFFWKERLSLVLRASVYLLVPFAVYLSNTPATDGKNGPPLTAYTMSFGIFAVLIIVISKLSRRTGGFKSSPMDFLIIILAVAVPNIPDQRLQEYQIGLIAAKVIMLYFSYEVLLAELRGKLKLVAGATVVSLLVLASR
jgi:UDP-GlcNAc:undecaprenyl-phosphate/decaprenyl-phosphate GlcNAc-1-phosphate transferase